MYGFTPDGAALVFVDCFALTRLSLPRTCKSDRKIRGGVTSGVSISADGSRALTWQRGPDRLILWELPTLKALRRFERGELPGGAQLHPDGARLITLEDDALALLDAAANARSVLGRVPLTGGRTLPPARVPATRREPARRDRRALVVRADGSFMVARGDELLAGTLDAGVRWRRALRGGGRLRLFPGRARATALLERGHRTWLIDHNDALLEITSVSPAVVVDHALAFQPDAGAVVLRDRERDEDAVFELAPAPEPAAEHAGAGTIMLGGGDEPPLLYLPWHRETLLDLRAGAELPRKLPPAERATRRDVLRRARPLARTAGALGMRLELIDVDLNSKRAAVTIALRCAGGEGLSAALLASAATGTWARAAPGGWRVSSYSLRGAPPYLDVVRIGELAEALRTLARAGAPLPATFGFWSALYERRLSGRAATGEAALPCDPEAEGLLARALLAALAGAGPLSAAELDALARAGSPTVEDALAGLEDYARRSAALGYETTRVLCFVFNHLLGAAAAPLWISVFFEQEWEFCGTLYYDFEDHGVLALARRYPEARSRFETWLSEHDLPDGDKRFYVARVRDALRAL